MGSDDKAKSKLIFVWVTRSQKQFEWLCDIIKDAEAWDASLGMILKVTSSNVPPVKNSIPQTFL